MASVLSNYLGNLILNNLFTTQGNRYIALHTDDPTVIGDPSTEVAGNGYQRQRVTWSASSSKTVANTNKLTFTSMPAATIKYLAIWDAPVGGNLLTSVVLPTPVSVLESGQVLVAVGDIALTL